MDTRKKARCTGKIKHPSKGKAEAALRALLRLEPDADMQVYLCPFPHKGKSHYHLGHTSVGNPNNKYRKGAGSAKKANPKTARD